MVLAEMICDSRSQSSQKSRGGLFDSKSGTFKMIVVTGRGPLPV